MSNVIDMDDYRDKWKELFRFTDEVSGSIMIVNANNLTGDVDVMQTNDEGETIVTHLNSILTRLLVDSLTETV